MNYREDLLPDEQQYSFVEISKGVPPEEAGTKLFEFDDWDNVKLPPDGPLEFYVVYDEAGNEVSEERSLPDDGSGGDNPGGNDPETGKLNLPDGRNY